MEIIITSLNNKYIVKFQDFREATLISIFKECICCNNHLEV